jgi:hypothetical protein
MGLLFLQAYQEMFGQRHSQGKLIAKQKSQEFFS